MSAKIWRRRRWNRLCLADSAYGVCHRTRYHRPGEHATYIGGGRPFGRGRGGGPEVWFFFGPAVDRPGYRHGKVR